MRACLPGLGTGKREMGSGVEGSVVTHGDSKALHLSWKPGSFSRTTRLPFVLPHSGNLAGLVITKSSRARPGAQPPAFPRGVGRKRWVRPGRCSGLCALRLEPGAPIRVGGTSVDVWGACDSAKPSSLVTPFPSWFKGVFLFKSSVSTWF